MANDAVLFQEIAINQADMHFGEVEAINLYRFGAFGAIALVGIEQKNAVLHSFEMRGKAHR